jgi:hypothetical protein
MYTCDAIVGEIGCLVEALECVEAEKVEIPLVSVLLEVADLESKRERTYKR